MSGDIKILYDRDLRELDASIVDGDVVLDDGLDTAVYLSLFTDRRARDDDPFENGDKRGWWGDQTAKVVGDQIGSRLWLLDRAKTTVENIKLAKIYIEEALKWLVEDGVAKKVEAFSERTGQPGNDRLFMLARIEKSDGTDITYKFDALWASQMEA